MVFDDARPVAGNPGAAPAPARTVRPRRGLPGGRAVVGGLLVAVAAVGTFAAATRGEGTVGVAHVVAARAVPPGAVLGPDDLTVATGDLSGPLRAHAFATPGDVVGAVTIGPVAAGELIQAGGLVPGPEGSAPTVTVAVDRADALGGALRGGDVVQVLATYGSDATAETRLLAAEARVVRVGSADDALGRAGTVEVTLALADAVERSAVVHASVAGRLTFVRVTGIATPGATPSYRPGGDAG